MACMCGDFCCSSCGPAQGNHRCPICREWASDCCEHLDGETGGLKAEFQAEAERIWAAEKAADEQYDRWMEEAYKRGEL